MVSTVFCCAGELLSEGTTGLGRTRKAHGATAARSARALSRNHGLRGREEDLDIHPERVRPGISEIEADHFIERRTASPCNLPESRDSGLGLQHAPAMPRLILLDLVRKGRP